MFMARSVRCSVQVISKNITFVDTTRLKLCQSHCLCQFIPSNSYPSLEMGDVPKPPFGQ